MGLPNPNSFSLGQLTGNRKQSKFLISTVGSNGADQKSSY